MIAIRNFSFFLFALLFAAALAGCGSDDGGGEVTTAPTQEPPPPADVTLEQLAGTWFGTFDDKKSVRTFEFTVSAGNMSNIKLAGADTRLTGTITKATEVPRAFRFAISSSGNQIASGMMLVDLSAAHMLYLDRHFDFAVVQKGATQHPAYAQTDIDANWAGETIATTGGFTTLTRRGTSTANCTPTSPAATPPSSSCAITIGSTSRTASSVVKDHDLGRFKGIFADQPPGGTPQNVAWRAFLSPDKSFAAVWACNDFTGGFPQTCDFSAWKKQ